MFYSCQYDTEKLNKVFSMEGNEKSWIDWCALHSTGVALDLCCYCMLG